MLKAQGDVLAFLECRRMKRWPRYEEALRLYRAVGARVGEANVLQAQGDVLAFLDQRTKRWRATRRRCGSTGRWATGWARPTCSRQGDVRFLEADG